MQNCSEILPQSLGHYIRYCVEEESRISCSVISFALCFMFNIPGYVTGPKIGGIISALAGVHCFDTQRNKRIFKKILYIIKQAIQRQFIMVRK